MGVSDVYSPVPVKPPLKRSLNEDFNPKLECAPKRHQSRSPIVNWLSNVPFPSLRAQIVLANFDSYQIPPAVDDLDEEPKSPVSIYEMPGDRQDESFSQGSTRSLSRSKIKTSDPKYRSVLDNNGVFMDRSGMERPDVITNMVQTQLFKPRTSPPLSRDVLLKTVNQTDQWSVSTENVVSNLLNTPMFPLDRPGLALGGNSQWPSAALPTNPDYPHPVALPKPDFHLGYPIGRRSEWSSREAAVVDHPHALPYTQPGTGNRLPFLTLELKSEATGGTLWHAENQAAGSGTCCVKAMEWLLSQAYALQPGSTDTIAFSASATARQVVFYTHYYSPEQGAYFMSYLKSFMTTDPEHIQQCRNLTNNILDYGLGMRQDKLRECLESLFPQMDSKWKKSHRATDVDKEEEGEPSFTTLVSENRRSSATTQSIATKESKRRR